MRERYPAGKYRILHVGRKEPQKNGDTVIRALAHLGPDYSLIMLGPGKEDWLWKVSITGKSEIFVQREMAVVVTYAVKEGCISESFFFRNIF